MIEWCFLMCRPQSGIAVDGPRLDYSKPVTSTQSENPWRGDWVCRRGVDAARRQRLQIVRPIDGDPPQDDARVRQVEDIEHALERVLALDEGLRHAQIEQAHPVVAAGLSFDDHVDQLIQGVRSL